MLGCTVLEYRKAKIVYKENWIPSRPNLWQETLASVNLSLLSLKSRWKMADLVVTCRFIHGLYDISLADVGLSICKSNFRGRGLSLQQ